MFVSYVALMIGAAGPHPGWACSHITQADDVMMEPEVCLTTPWYEGLFWVLLHVWTKNNSSFTLHYVHPWILFQYLKKHWNWKSLTECSPLEQRQCAVPLPILPTRTPWLWRISIHFIWSNLQPLRPHSRGSAFDESFANVVSISTCKFKLKSRS